MKVNIFYILLILYIFVNFGYMLIGISDSGMNIEFQEFTIKPESFVIAFILQCLCLFIIFLFYFWVNRKIKNTNLLFGPKVGNILAIWQVLFVFFNLYYGVNIAGSDKRFESLNAINVLFIIAPPDILYLLIAPSLKKDSQFKINSIVYLISTLSRGWMGGGFIFIITIFCRKLYIKITTKKITFFLIILALILMLSPYLIALKWGIRGDGNIIDILYVNLINIEYKELLLESLHYIFNRFQHVGHVALIYENQDLLHNLYLNNKIGEYWQEGLPQLLFNKIFSIEEVHTFSKVVTIFLFNQSYDVSWSANTGMAGWLLILNEYLFFYILYLFFVFFTLAFFMIKNCNKQTLLIMSSLTLLFLFHGWIGMYFNVCLYLFIIFIIGKIKI